MRLREIYQKQIIDRLRSEFGYKNIMAVPKLTKVTVNVGVGRHSKEKAYIEAVVKTVQQITGQKPVLTKARQSISAFKVRQGEIVGVVATLRGQRMYDFVEKLVNVTLPRVRDFRGIDPKQVDRHGNLSIGFREQLAFPEILSDQTDTVHGLEVNLTTTAGKRDAGLALFTYLGFPFNKK